MIKRNVKIFIKFVFIVLLFLLGILFLKHGFNDYTFDKLPFSEKNQIDYKVYLKENNFFDTKYLGMNQAYITSLIDYLDVNFNYNLVLDESRNGSYTYYIKGIMSADIQNSSSSYWKKEYKITEPKTEEFKNKSVITINENAKISYDKYNDLLKSFKNEYGLSMDGSLKIFLYVTTNVNSELNGQKLVQNASSSISIPLTKATIEVPIAVNANSTKGILISDVIHLDSISYMISKIVGSILILIAVILLIKLVLVFVKKGEKKLSYIKKLKNILKTYDGIIVNSTNIPSTEGMKVIEVSEFGELLDAHSEVRLPINYYEDNKKAIFILMNESLAWKYTLEKE